MKAAARPSGSWSSAAEQPHPAAPSPAVRARHTTGPGSSSAAWIRRAVAPSPVGPTGSTPAPSPGGPTGSTPAPSPGGPSGSASPPAHAGETRRGIAPAKVNLVLEVLGRRPDGYHELRSVMAPLALADTLTVRPSGRSGTDRLRQLGEACGPVGDNIVMLAASLVREWSGRDLPPLRFELTKRTPAGAGLGGGSSDGACALRLAAAAWGLRLGASELRALALRLGSDVPFFLRDSWAIVGGRGERVRDLPAPHGGPLGIVLVTPATRLSTREVFAVHDARPETDAGAGLPRAGAGRSDALATGLRSGCSGSDLLALQPANDLWPAATTLLPELRELRSGIEQVLGRPVHLSGSGPTLFVLYASAQAARRAGDRVRRALRDGEIPRGPNQPPTVVATATRGGSA